MNKKEIIALKSKFMLWLSIVLIVIIVAIALIITIRDWDYPWGRIGIFFYVIPVSAGLLIIPIILLIIWLCRPKALIILGDGELIYHQKKVSLENVQSISLSGLFMMTLNINVDNQVIKIRFVKKAKLVAKYINALVTEAQIIKNSITQ